MQKSISRSFEIIELNLDEPRMFQKGKWRGRLFERKASSRDNKSSNEKSTQAYRLFEEGKKPVEVAIQLGHSEKEVTRYYTEFWKLKRLYKLYQIYTQIEHCIPSFLKLHSALKKKRFDSWQFGLEDFFR